MLTIQYRITYTGVVGPHHVDETGMRREVCTVQARDINSGYTKALKIARQPLGNGNRREIAAIEFWQA